MLALKKRKETKSFVVCIVRLLRLNCGLCPVVFGESDETNKDIKDHLSMGVLNSGSVTDGRKPYSLAVYTTPRYYLWMKFTQWKHGQ